MFKRKNPKLPTFPQLREHILSAGKRVPATALILAHYSFLLYAETLNPGDINDLPTIWGATNEKLRMLAALTSLSFTLSFIIFNYFKYKADWKDIFAKTRGQNPLVRIIKTLILANDTHPVVTSSIFMHLMITTLIATGLITIGHNQPLPPIHSALDHLKLHRNEQRTLLQLIFDKFAGLELFFYNILHGQ